MQIDSTLQFFSKTGPNSKQADEKSIFWAEGIQSPKNKILKYKIIVLRADTCFSSQRGYQTFAGCFSRVNARGQRREISCSSTWTSSSWKRQPPNRNCGNPPNNTPPQKNKTPFGRPSNISKIRSSPVNKKRQPKVKGNWIQAQQWWLFFALLASLRPKNCAKLQFTPIYQHKNDTSLGSTSSK